MRYVIDGCSNVPGAFDVVDWVGMFKGSVGWGVREIHEQIATQLVRILS